MQPKKQIQTKFILEKAGVPYLCNTVLKFRQHQVSPNLHGSKDSPLLAISQDIGETGSVYTFYFEYCKIDHQEKVKFERE